MAASIVTHKMRIRDRLHVRDIRAVLRCRIHLCVVFAVSVGVMAGCGSESPIELQPGATGVYWALTTDIHAATIAVGSTQRLTATPRNVVGAAILSLPMPRFRSLDTSKVKVDAAGVLTGVDVTANTLVIASLTVDGVTNADTTLVVVTAAPSTMATFTIHPTDSTKLARGSARYLMANATDGDGFQLYGFAVQYKSLDTTVATITSTGYMQGKAKGTVKIVASTTSWGTSQTDTVEFTITNPAVATVVMYGSLYPTLGAFSPSSVIIGLNGRVTWYNYTGGASSITFDNDVANIPGGNITSMTVYGSAFRTFPTAGTYHFRDAAGNTGTVVVLPD